MKPIRKAQDLTAGSRQAALLSQAEAGSIASARGKKVWGVGAAALGEVLLHRSSDLCMGVREALLGPRPGQEKVRLRTGAPGSVQDPEMIKDRSTGRFGGEEGQSLVLSGLDLCPTLGEISGLGSTMRDRHSHSGHTAFLPLPYHLPLL